MADRVKSKDGVKETDAYLSDVDTPPHQGADGGETSRKVGSRDEEKSAEGNDGATRVKGSDKRGEGVDGPNATQSRS
ncbi:hypothetical protein [Wenxinia saemankumensis]|uniref:Uncharacterized protein n=1 Tax=Wenxinia saemankumensis TaxID=1447782 RepID=A0A1M6ENV1_9RHOB|nr:hypothetical protein [Wenxinia saemankumensis]SHI87185.1 hypothetical protein SAMN05444417_2098 [Wenxinia saemankumensis]